MLRSLAAFFVFMLVLQTGASAQFAKGRKMIGVSLGSAFFNAGQYDYSYAGGTPPFTSRTDAFGINISPEAGIFVADNLLIGARITGGYKKDKASDEENGNTFRKRTTSDYVTTAGLFARYYFQGKKLIPFAQFAVDAGVSNSKTEGFNYTTAYKETYDSKSSGGFLLSPSLTFGATRMISDRIGIDFFAGYIYTTQKRKNVLNTQIDLGFDGTIDEGSISTTDSKFSNHGFTLGAGFRIFL